MKREADEETQQTPYPNNKRQFTSRNNVTPDNEADIQDGPVNEKILSVLESLPPETLRRLEEKASTTEGARDLIDQLIPDICKRINMPHEEMVERVEKIKNFYFPEDVSLPLDNFSLIFAETLYRTLLTGSQIYPFWWMSWKHQV